MRTQFETPFEYAQKALEIAAHTPAVSTKKPENFKRIMRENRGAISLFSPYGPTSDGLERKNPVIVALGDSVTAGHFEFSGDPAKLFEKVDKGEICEDNVWYEKASLPRCHPVSA